ncbi:MAG: condensation domain-containing protein [Methanobacterium sp. ERen5]|nr:MAG: condensation domain-containing protein [Methanobacterium sp. ERen5]
MSITNKKKISTNKDFLSVSHNIRTVSNGERAFLWRPDCTVSMITRIEGDVSQEDLRQSISKVRQMHPLVGAKIVFKEDHSAEFSTENVPLPNFRIVNRVSDTQWFDELRNELKVPFDIENGPMIRFTLLHSNDVSDLIITCNHSICDGMSLSYLVRDLLTNYVDPKKEVEVLNPPEIMELLPKGKISFSSLMTRIILYSANKKWKKSPITSPLKIMPHFRTHTGKKLTLAQFSLNWNPTKQKLF